MDTSRFDQLARAFSSDGTRRALLRLLAAVPLFAGLASLPGAGDVDAAGRRKRRKQRKRSKQRKQRNQRNQRKSGRQPKRSSPCLPDPLDQTCTGTCGTVHDNCGTRVDCGPCLCDPPCGACQICSGALVCEACQPCCNGACCARPTAVCHTATGECCVPESKARTCEGRCGAVANTCGAVVDCGSCACPGGCPVCQRCHEETGACVPDPGQTGVDCGGPGQICQSDGACSCGASSCAAGQRCQAGACVCDGASCPEGCCDDGAVCHVDDDAACGIDGGRCVSCVEPETCGGGNPGVPGICGCTPIDVCPAGQECGSIADGCGGTLSCGACGNPAPICDGSGRCAPCETSAECAAAGPGDRCCSGSCGTGVCCAAAECQPAGNRCTDFACLCGGSDACSGDTPTCCGDPGACTNTQTDARNCNECGRRCPGDEVCDGGACRAPRCGEPKGPCLVFITASTHTGDLNGLAGADDICRSEARAAGLSGTFMAWLSTDAASPATRFPTKGSGPYRLVTGELVAFSWQGLTHSGRDLDHAINKTATGSSPSGFLVWTHTRDDGTPNNGPDCRDWTSDANTDEGDVGAAVANSRWTVDGESPCNWTLGHLYCVQQS